MLAPVTTDTLLLFWVQGAAEVKKHNRNRYPPLHPFNIVIWKKVTLSFRPSNPTPLPPLRHDSRAESHRGKTLQSIPSTTAQQIIGEADKGWTRLVYGWNLEVSGKCNFYQGYLYNSLVQKQKIKILEVQEIFHSLNFVISFIYFFFLSLKEGKEGVSVLNYKADLQLVAQ